MKNDSSSDVFKKLRLKFALTLILVLAAFMIFLIAGMNINLRKSNRMEAEVFMDMLFQNDGFLSYGPGRPLISDGKNNNSANTTDKAADSDKHNLLGQAPGSLLNPVEGNGKPVPMDPPRNPPRDNKGSSSDSAFDDDGQRNLNEFGEPLPPDLIALNESSGNQSVLGQNKYVPDEPGKGVSGYFRDLFTSVNHKPRGLRDFCSAMVSADGKIISINNDFNNGMDQDAETQLIQTVYFSGKTSGIYRTWYYRIQGEKYGYMVVLLDREFERAQEMRYFVSSTVFFALSLVIVFIIAFILSDLSVKPVRNAFYRQKQFIADASHELKTPIAVIGANIDVLQQEIPDNKWLEYIKTENIRMGGLVKDMLYLAKHDADRLEHTFLPFDLCDAVACAVLPFESVAFEQKKKLEIEIPKNIIVVSGDEEEVKRVAIILTDNAIKNSDEDAVIKISVGADGNKAYVKVWNSGHGISQEDMKKIFDRFYRADTSRARATGGYGLGLAIAKTIADSHNGKILVESEIDEYACFTFILPCENPEHHRKGFLRKH